jgi:hypothetical protein
MVRVVDAVQGSFPRSSKPGNVLQDKRLGKHNSQLHHTEQPQQGNSETKYRQITKSDSNAETHPLF